MERSASLLDGIDNSQAEAIHRLLATFSATIEAKNWHGLPPCDIQLNTRIVPECMSQTVSWLSRKLTQPWLRPEQFTVRHTFIPNNLRRNASTIFVIAWEELEVIASDGCVCLMIRQSEVRLDEYVNDWKLSHVLYQKPRFAPQVHTAWSSEVSQCLQYLHQSLRSLDLGQASNYSALLNHCLKRIHRCQLSSDATIAIDASQIGEIERKALLWATENAMTRWNYITHNHSCFTWVQSDDKPDILIQGLREPIAGDNLGVFLDISYVPSVSKLAKSAIVQVTTNGSSEHKPLCLRPEEIRYTIEHELGHYLGLKDCDHIGSIMTATDWKRPLPTPDATERLAIIRRLSLLERYKTQIYRLTIPGKYDLKSTVDYLNLYQSNSPHNPLGGSEIAFKHDRIEDWVSLVWEAERLVCRGEYDLALKRLAQARQLSSNNIEVEVRIGLIMALYTKDFTPAIEILERSLRYPYRTWDYLHPWYLHATLAYVYKNLQDEPSFRQHTAKKQLHLLIKAINRNWWLLKICRPSIAIRYLLPMCRDIVKLLIHQLCYWFAQIYC